MPICNVELSEELASVIAARVASGHYADASAVLHSALRQLEREEQEYDEKVTVLQDALADIDRIAAYTTGI
jgi:putative addiction module CopG family antidote